MTVYFTQIGPGSCCAEIGRDGTVSTGNYDVRTGIVKYIY